MEAERVVRVNLIACGYGRRRRLSMNAQNDYSPAPFNAHLNQQINAGADFAVFHGIVEKTGDNESDDSV